MTVRCCLILNPDFSIMFQRRLILNFGRRFLRVFRCWLILNLEPATLEDVSLPFDLESEI